MIGDLRALAALTSDDAGAQRLAWSPQWRRARRWLEDRLSELPCEVRTDPAGNLLAELPGQTGAFLAIGSHIDSVPGGGWLDGTLGVLAGLEILRAHAASPRRRRLGLRLIDWADEEGARFGRSLFGSGVASEAIDAEDQAELIDSNGITLAEAMRACGLDVQATGPATLTLEGVAAYLELHIEQGPVLERTGRQLAVVTGTVGVERRLLSLEGEAAHAGAAPMDMRRDPVVAAAEVISAVVDLAVAAGATATFGAIEARPGVVSIVPHTCEVVVDLRHPETVTLTRLVVDVDAAVERLAAGQGVQPRWSPQWRIEPIPFDARLVRAAREACSDVGVDPLVMASGALHDAAAAARRVPVTMLMTPSERGISHNPAENTSDEDLVAGLRALAALTERVLATADSGEALGA
jgi:N-carbamoyl-L-amino-acid hydrolase